MERITAANCVGPARYGHEFRYRLAAGFIEEGNAILDAACGSGYGYWFLPPSISYMGVDIPGLAREGPPVSDRHYRIEADLQLWFPPWDFDVFIGFETIEHLPDYDNYINIAHQAGKWILLSTPVVPTLHLNPHHVHDFAPGDLQRLFEDEEWEHYQTVQQPSELSEVVVLRRRTWKQ